MPRCLSPVALTALLLACSQLLTSHPAHADEPEQLSGDDRYGTAVLASQHGWDASDEVVVATGTDYPDALAASALAAREGSPLLLVPEDRLPAAVAEEIARLAASQVTIVGGPEAVSSALSGDLAALSDVDEVERLAGPDRYATAAAVAAEASPGGQALLVSGEDFPDAVVATALTTDGEAPILLTEPRRFSPAASRALSDLSVDRVTVVGGEDAVAAEVADEATRVAGDLDRIAGADRYATSTAVAAAALADGGADVSTPVIASGRSFSDALVAGVHAARTDGVLVLAAPRQPEGALDEFLRSETERWSTPIVVGGSLSGSAVEAIHRSVVDEPHPEPEPEPEVEAAEEPEPTPGEIAVQAAREQIGSAYQWGGNGPNAFDCSGLTRWAWDAAGFTIPRTSSNQFASLPRVAAGAERPGDIVAFGSPVYHVGIYIGDGKMIDAPRPGQTVQVRDVFRSDRRGFVRPNG